MFQLAQLLPPALVGTMFTSMALLKIYGFSRGIVGGACKPWSQRICGACPSWSLPLNIAMAILFLVIGVGNLAWLGFLLSQPATS
jgi:hypothetical protein